MRSNDNNRKRPAKATLAALAVVAALASGCMPMRGSGMATGPAATAGLEARSGSSASGSVRLLQHADGVHLMGEVRGLQPNAEHGFHVHERGDCSSADATSAGGHFNPDNAPHGRAGQGSHHAGDMPNLRADANGVARVHVVVPGLTVAPGAKSVTGKALVVHRDPDDYRSQPAGNSGARIACGLIVQESGARGPGGSGGY